MKPNLIFLFATLGAAVLAGCDRPGEVPLSPPGAPTPTTQNQAAPQQAPQAPAPSAAARKDGGAPVQGQVDTREPAQRQAFETPKR